MSKPVVTRWILHYLNGETVVGAWSPGDWVSFRESVKKAPVVSLQLQTKFDKKLHTLSAKSLNKECAKFWQEDCYEYHTSTGQNILVAKRILMELEKDKWLVLELTISNGEVKNYIVEKNINGQWYE